MRVESKITSKQFSTYRSSGAKCSELSENRWCLGFCREWLPARLLGLPQEFRSCKNPSLLMITFHHTLPVRCITFQWSTFVNMEARNTLQHCFSSRCWIWTFRPCSCPELIQGSLRKISQPKGIQDGNKPFTNTEITYHFWQYKWLQSSCRTTLERWRLDKELWATQRLCNTLPMHVALGRLIVGLK